MINKFCKVKIDGGRKGGFNPPVRIFDPRFGLVRWLEKIQKQDTYYYRNR
jgi:hypothetical protein